MYEYLLIYHPPYELLLRKVGSLVGHFFRLTHDKFCHINVLDIFLYFLQLSYFILTIATSNGYNALYTACRGNDVTLLESLLKEEEYVRVVNQVVSQFFFFNLIKSQQNVDISCFVLY